MRRPDYLDLDAIAHRAALRGLSLADAEDSLTEDLLIDGEEEQETEE